MKWGKTMNYKMEEINQLLEHINMNAITPGTAYGTYLLCKCPFCENYEMIVDTIQKTFVCSTCGKSGNILNYLMELHHIDIHTAIRMLSKITGDKITYQKENNICLSDKVLLRKIHHFMMLFYQRNLSDSQCLEYIKKRGLSEESIQKFKIGYSGKFGSDLFEYLKKCGIKETDLLNSNLFGSSIQYGKIIYFDKFYDRLMFPIFNSNGAIAGFGGRTISDNNVKYLNSSESILFHKGNLLYGYHIAKHSTKDYLILCEGNLDMISCQQAGLDNIVCSLGTALTEEHIKLLSRDYKKVVLAYDNDEAGKKAILRASQLLKKYQIKVNIMDLNPCKDPDEFIRTYGKIKFIERVNKSIQLGTYMSQYIAGLQNTEKIEAIERMLCGD